MSDLSSSGPGSAYGPAWAQAVAASRGLVVAEDELEPLARSVAPTLERFAAIAQDLTADDDMYEFRRLLAQEAEDG
jgi:hypothetical protein